MFKFILIIFTSLFCISSFGEEVKVLVSSQSSDGLIDKDLDQSFLDNYTKHLTARLQQTTRASLDSKGLKDVKFKLESGSVYLHTKKQKLIVTRFKIIPQNLYQVSIAGIKGDQLFRIGCIGTTPDPVSITRGDCGKKIIEIFGPI